MQASVPHTTPALRATPPRGGGEVGCANITGIPLLFSGGVARSAGVVGTKCRVVKFCKRSVKVCRIIAALLLVAI